MVKKGKVVEKKYLQGYPLRQIQVVVSLQCTDQCQLGVWVVGVLVVAVVYSVQCADQYQLGGRVVVTIL